MQIRAFSTPPRAILMPVRAFSTPLRAILMLIRAFPLLDEAYPMSGRLAAPSGLAPGEPVSTSETRDGKVPYSPI